MYNLRKIYIPMKLFVMCNFHSISLSPDEASFVDHADLNDRLLLLFHLIVKCQIFSSCHPLPVLSLSIGKEQEQVKDKDDEALRSPDMFSPSQEDR